MLNCKLFANYDETLFANDNFHDIIIKNHVGANMTGCVALRKDVYYIRLSYYDRGRVRRDKWVSTGLSGRGAQKKAMAMIDSMIEKYSYLEKSDHPSKMADYLKMWKELQLNEVAETTYDGYHTYIDRHIIPYFKDLNIDIQDVTAGHIFDYVNYLSGDKGRKGNKVGGQSLTSIRKIISILRKVFDYAVMYGDIKINPALQVPLPKREKNSNNINKNKRQVFMTAEDAQKMLDAFRDEEIGPIIFVTLYYGLRRSEALGLRWQAIDFDANTISINHTVVGGTRIIAKDDTKSYCSILNSTSNSCYIQTLLFEARSSNMTLFQEHIYHLPWS